MMGKLDGKVAIISGSAQGVGRGVALALHKHGAKVVILDINQAGAEKTAADIVADGGQAIGLVCDITKKEQIQQVVDKTVEVFGTVDILVNNAHASTQKPLELLTEDDFALSFNTGFWATHYFMQAVFPIFQAKNQGKIINFGSNSSILGHAYQGAYAAAKEAIGAITKVAATEWGKYHINVNILCPFANSPGMIAWSEKFPEEYEKSLSRIPLHRVGDCQNDIGEVAAWLASYESDYVTGQTILADGGAHYIR